jgi:hypothetical protein
VQPFPFFDEAEIGHLDLAHRVTGELSQPFLHFAGILSFGVIKVRSRPSLNVGLATYIGVASAVTVSRVMVRPDSLFAISNSR